MTTLAAPEGNLHSIPALLARNVARYGNRPAYREKEFGIWQTWTWAEAAEEIRALALGFLALGLNRGDHVAIVGRTRPMHYWSMVAAQMCGAVPVPLYQDAVAEELAYVLGHCGARFVVCGDQEQVDKVIEAEQQAHIVDQVIYTDKRGMRKYDHTRMNALADVQAEGRAAAQRLGPELDARIAELTYDSTCVMLYTSGTTGKPKGVVLSNRNIIETGKNTAGFDHLGPDEDVVAYLPMAWVGDFIFSMGQGMYAGFCVNCPEGAHTLMTDLREIGPTYLFAPPRIFENMLTNVMIRMEDAGDLKYGMFNYFMDFAKDTGEEFGMPRYRVQRSKPTLRRRLRWGWRYAMGIGFAVETMVENMVRLSLAKLRHGKKARDHFKAQGPLLNLYPQPWRDYFTYRTGETMIYSPLKDTLGLSRVRVAYTAGEAIGPEIFDFYRSLGINLKQLYGQTEASVFINQQPDGQVRSDTVGVPSPGVEVRIAENGEVFYRSPGTFVEYYNNPDSTASTKDPEGWVATGDAGFFEKGTGQLRIIDRAKDVGRMADGSMFAPKYVENKLKFYPNILEAVVIGNGRDYCTAFINIDLTAVGNWAERNNVAYASYQELAAHPQVYATIGKHVEEVNASVAQDPMLSGCQIHRFLILHKELDADDGEMTRTRKVKRGAIAEKYAELIDALYDGRDSVYTETEVTYEDGRKGRLKATLRIDDAQVFPAAGQHRVAAE